MKTRAWIVTLTAVVLLAAMLLSTGCDFRPAVVPSNSTETPTEPETTEPETTEPETTEPETTEPVTSEPVTSEPATSEPATSAPATSAPATSAPATSAPATSATQSSTSGSTNPPETPYINPLTGVGSTVDTSEKRPLAVVIANYYLKSINQTEPQANLAKADVIFEYPVEGNYTRLLALFSDYSSVGEIGAIRSGRYYDIQLALGFNAIYASCGGSDLYKISDSLIKYGAYYYFNNHLIDNLDFTNDKTVTGLKLTQRAYLQGLGAGSTNSVSVSGADFVKAIDKKGYSTALSNAYDYGHVFQFSNTTVLFSNIARNIKFNVSASRQVDFIYNGNDALYYRYQFDDAEGNLAHVDSANNNQQLAFTNVILMYTDVSEISEDAKSSGNEAALDRKYVNVVGSGTGVYMTCGTMTEITWRKTNENAPLKFYLPGGEEVTFNPGKTFIEILPSTYSTGLEVK